MTLRPFRLTCSVTLGPIYGLNRLAAASSAEVQKNFGRYKDAALAEPVVVTQYGKPSVVILAATDYERLKELDRRILLLDEMSGLRGPCQSRP